MTPGNVFVQPSAPTSAASAATPGAVERGTTDFMLMLSQVAGTPTAASAAVAQATATFANQAEESTTELPDAEDIVGLFSMSLPAMPSDLRDIAAAAQSFGVAGLAGADGKRAPALAAELQSLTELTSADPVEDGSGAAFDSVHVQPSGTEKQQIGQSLAASAAVSRPVHTPVGSGAWPDEIGSRVMMMAEQGRQTASLRLSPEHLGPLEINITIQDDRASVWFGAAHADTRSAIEHALPRLRELFESQGLSLTDAGVYKDSAREQAAAQMRTSGAGGDVGSEEDQTVTASSARVGLVDAYA